MISTCSLLIFSIFLYVRCSLVLFVSFLYQPIIFTYYIDLLVCVVFGGIPSVSKDGNGCLGIGQFQIIIQVIPIFNIIYHRYCGKF